MENLDVIKNTSHKRDRDGSDELESLESRRTRNKTRSHNSSRLLKANSDELELYSPESTKIPVDILDILDEDDVETQELETFMKSFEEEILHPSPPQEDTRFSTVSPNLDYLLEASDNELGLPPAISPEKEKLIPVTETKPNHGSLALGFDEDDFVFHKDLKTNFDNAFEFENDFGFENEFGDFSDFCFQS